VNLLKKCACLLVFALPSMAGTGQTGTTSAAPIVIQRNVEMKTRDGVTLRADIYQPAAEGSYPVLLQRTPYNKDEEAEFGSRAAAHGYIVVVQDVRGRYTSDGEWYTFKHESEDGYDAVEWAAALPHSNGKVGMFGGSYVGATQMLAAIAHPPHLAGICPVVTASNYHENWTYQGGAFEQWFNQSWAAGLAQNTILHFAEHHTNALKGTSAAPLNRFPVFNIAGTETGAQLTRTLAPYYLDWLAHPNYDDFWKRWAIDENYQNIQVPALTVAAWYDIFQDGSLRNYMGMRDHAGNEAARTGQRLLVVIGGHAGGGRHIGAVDFGPAAAEFDEDETTLRWYNYLFKGEANEFADASKPVRIFVMGTNVWRNEEEWPLKRAKQDRYLLGSNTNANSAAGNGFLLEPGVMKRTSGAPADTYIYDPANPVPTTGGPLCCDAGLLAGGPQSQEKVEARKDVLVYSTGPLNQDVEVTGPVTLDLFASTTAADTDFTGKLVDVAPDGTAINITEGILRAKYCEGTRVAPNPVKPGEVVEYKIDLWSTSNVFLKGHRIRLEVSSSNFPRFDRNLNTGEDGAASVEMRKATNTIYHDAGHPSALVLQVVEKAASSF